MYENNDRFTKNEGKVPDSFSFAVDMTDTGEDRLIKFYEEQQQKEDEQTIFDSKDQFEFTPAIYNLPVV